MKLFLGGLFACLLLLAIRASELPTRQAYLLAGDIMGMGTLHPAILYRVENGSLTKMRTIVTKQQNAEMIRAYQDKGFVLMHSNVMGHRPGPVILDVIDLSSVATELIYEIDLCEDCSYTNGHFINKNGRLIYLVVALDDSYMAFYYGIDVATGAVVDDLGLSDFKYLHLIGTTHRSGSDILRSIAFDDQRPHISNRDTKEKVYFDFVLPDIFEDRDCCLNLIIHNDFVRMFVPLRLPDEPRLDKVPFYVMDTSDGEWVKLNYSPTSVHRAFHEWIATGESRRAADLGDDHYDRLPTKRVEPFLSTQERFKGMGWAPTGRLRFYNVRTKKEVVHDTGEPDSEILLIDENDVAYIRMADQLWRGRIADDGLEGMEMMAQSDALLNVHWMVLGYE